jgi:DUF3040 family protein
MPDASERRSVMDPGEQARRLHAVERGLLVTDAVWARDVFGHTALPLRRTWWVLCLAVDVAAVALLVAGVLAVLPLAFLGCVLANVGVCMHLERGSRRTVRADRGCGLLTETGPPIGHRRVLDPGQHR